MSTQIQPLNDNVVIRRADAQTETESGILLPDSSEEKAAEGEVIAVGRGKTLPSGEYNTPDVRVGDRVVFGQKAGSDLVVDGETLLVVVEEEIIAILR